jgi:MoaA/NifB/PqqE/SkfB family radical SAM enzyme
VANILITNVCNRSCPYCFARQKVSLDDMTPEEQIDESKDSKAFISIENYKTALEFLVRSKCRVISLLGGEPTLHPQFTRLVEMALDTGLSLKIFTNGLMSQAKAEFLASQTKEIRMVVNVNEPDRTPAGQWEHVNRTLSVLGQKASLSFNIYRQDCQMDFLVNLILERGLDRIIRFGLAMPILGAKNSFPPIEEYRAIGRQLADFSDVCAPHDIAVHLDCGFTMCMFSHEELGRMLCNHADTHFMCDPIIDIAPDLTVWCCFPLAGVENVRLTDFENRQQIVDHYNRIFGAFRRVGALPECVGCPQIRRGQCKGGCIVHTMKSFGLEKNKLEPQAAL